jgi:hypothetical protein
MTATQPDAQPDSPTQNSDQSNSRWFSIRYATAAGKGLPAMFQAARVCTYVDEEGTWLIALWDNTNRSTAAANCILRVPADHVVGVHEHGSLREAAEMAYGPTQGTQ